MSRHRSSLPPRIWSPDVLRSFDPKSSVAFRMAAAKGHIKCIPHELLIVLYALSFDKDPEVVKTAAHTAMTLPAHIRAALADDRLHPKVLGYFGRLYIGDADTVEMVVRNAATNQKVAADLFAMASEPIAKMISRVSRHFDLRLS